MKSVFWLVRDSIAGRPGPQMQPWMAAVDHHLHAVGPAALIAVGQMADAAADALRWNRRVCGRRCLGRSVRRRRQSQ